MENSTRATPLPESAASAVIKTAEPETISPSTGLVMITVGAIVSCTVTVASAVPVLPTASVAEKVTVVTPKGNSAGASLATARDPSTSSKAVAAARKAAIAALAASVPPGPSASTVMLAGAVTTGAVVSSAVMGAVVVPVPVPMPVLAKTGPIHNATDRVAIAKKANPFRYIIFPFGGFLGTVVAPLARRHI